MEQEGELRMNLTSVGRKAGIAVIALLAFHSTSNSIIDASPSLQSKNSAPCAAPEYRSFDFFVGDWDAFDFDNPSKRVARNRVTRILDDCVVLEDYQDTEGHHGQSFSIYDESRKVWHQTWVTNHGSLLIIEGNMRDGEMVLEGTDRTADGKERHVRGIWKPMSAGVRETAVTSTNGKTWKPWFDIAFRPAAAANSTVASDEAKAIAALDTEYQAAVKSNDAATMDWILADDFILVTGSGKSYTKTDLINDARSAQELYEHNEELEQKVRVWGDTAVVTAKLWEKGTDNGKPFNHTLWFSDTYARTPNGWRYVFGQSSLPVPNNSSVALKEQSPTERE